jgi:hypothetical protein
MKESAQWEMFRRTKPPSRGVLLLIVAAFVLPTYSYFLQEIRFWLVVLAILVGLGAFLRAAFILLQEGSCRGFHWMRLHVGRVAAPRHWRVILRSAMLRHLPHHR